MNISYKWLKEYVDFDMTADEVAEALTSIGLEVGSVDEVQTIRGGLKGLVVGHVLTCEPHPNSDHMHITTVDLGNGEAPTQIVCGAPNVAAGQKVIVATLGTKLYDGDNEFTIKKSKLRGVESNGMICAEDEIGVGQSHDGIMILPEETVVGTPAAEYFGLESDYLIEVDITPNRADACSHWGVARDLYAYLVRNDQPTALHRPGCEGFAVDNHDLPIDIVVENAEAYPRYCAVSLKGCEVKESPKWLQDKLTTIGLRPINNIVDITNYIMMAYGQPLHCFDADMVIGKKVVVKTMPEGTKFVTLDGVEHNLSDRDLAICNAEEPMCIAGVFGGKGSGTYETTTNVLFESAYFHPTWIRKSARRHGLNTDASFRFERGIDPDGQIYALKQAALMAKELAGGEVSMEIVDVEAGELPKTFEVELKYDYLNALVGKVIEPELVKRICTALDMTVKAEDESGLQLVIPAYRVDVQRPCDVVEDVLRVYGYNNVEIPTAVKSSLTIKGEEDRSYKLQKLISEQLVGAGFNEVLNNSLTREAYYNELKNYAPEHLVRLMNPLSSDLNVMRQTLLFGGLESIAHNANRKNSNLAFFEFGNCYFFDADRKKAAQEGATLEEIKADRKKWLAGYSEELHLGLWLTGNRVEGNWAHANEATSVYELKAHVMNILLRLGINMSQFLIEDGKNDIFAKSLVVTDRNGKIYLELGLVRKALCAACEVENEVYFADLNWTLLMKKMPKKDVSYKEIAKFPAVKRDLALLIDKSVTFGQIQKLVFAADKKLIKRVELFDVYEGKNLPAGKKSYAISIAIQDETKTLNDKAIDAIMQKVIKSVTTQLGAELR
ncbi:MAG: phenylalanine--tRNA ligase subunit beta [Bacteroidales bacterium]|nr:phenylalanine--tRNA ligase subunit beta [Bacteroidales bacterium]